MSKLQLASDNASNLFIPFSDGSVESIDKVSGESLWRSEFGGSILSPLVVEENKLYVASKTLQEENSEPKIDHTIAVRAISTSTGITNWQTVFGISNERATTDNVYLSSSMDKLFVFMKTGTMYCLDKQDGKVLWKVKFDFTITTLPVHFNNQIFISSSKNLITVSAANGQILKKQIVKSSPTVLLISDENTFFWGDKLGNMTALRMESGKTRWTIRTGGEISSITKVSQGLLVASFDNFIYLFSEKNGKRLWKKRMTGRSVSTPPVKDDVVIFSAFGGTEALFVEMAHGKTVNQVLLQDENYFTNNPIVSNNLVFFSTLKGVYAYDAENECRKIK